MGCYSARVGGHSGPAQLSSDDPATESRRPRILDPGRPDRVAAVAAHARHLSISSDHQPSPHPVSPLVPLRFLQLLVFPAFFLSFFFLKIRVFVLFCKFLSNLNFFPQLSNQLVSRVVMALSKRALLLLCRLACRCSTSPTACSPCCAPLTSRTSCELPGAAHPATAGSLPRPTPRVRRRPSARHPQSVI